MWNNIANILATHWKVAQWNFFKKENPNVIDLKKNLITNIIAQRKKHFHHTSMDNDTPSMDAAKALN